MIAFISKSNKLVSLVGAIIIAFCSCSLNYTQSNNTEDTVPEFKFDNMSLRKYQDNILEMEINADTMEQYKNDGGNFAVNARFTTWDKEGAIKTIGSCAILSIYSKQKLYTMFNDIIINNMSDDFEIYASSLKYDGNTEQLTSGINDKVFIKRSNVQIEGTGFSASGVSQSYSFDKLNSGNIQTEDNKEDKNNNLSDIKD